MIRSWLLAGVIVLGTVTPGIAIDKPRVPPGRDPGGVAIAIIGPGVDYTVPEIAARLARDGEGEVVGFDLIDGDRRPFEAEGGVEGQAMPRFLRPLFDTLVPIRLAVFRAKLGDRVRLAQAVMFASKSPARIVFMLGWSAEGSKPDFEFLAAASKQFPGLLFVVPAGDQAVAGDGAGGEDVSNVVVVASSSPVSGEPQGKRDGAAVVDVAVDGPSSSQAAAAHVAGLAARVSAANEALGGASLKGAVVALAKPGATVGGAVKTRYGVIETLGTDFRAK